MPKIKETIYEKLKKKTVFQSMDSSDSDSEKNPEVVVLSEEYGHDNVAHEGFSDIRKHNVPLLHEQSHKYQGEVSCRESNIPKNDNSISSATYPQIDLETSTDKNIEHINSVASDYETTAISISNSHSPMEVQKAKSVQNQLIIWENLLEARIHYQKVLNRANKLPYPREFQHFASHKEYSISVQETKQNLERLLEKLMETQVSLGMQHSEIKKLDLQKFTQKDKKKEYNFVHKTNFEKFKPYRNSVLLKWEDRTKLLTSHNAGKTGHFSEKLTIVKHINNHLIRLNELIAHTRIIKTSNRPSKHPISDDPNKTTQEICHVEIYDDTDFYHSQLRELIEYKTNTSANSHEINKQFSELQKLRQKMKKKVDTRASKGRKIRYIIHNKLINFMGSKCSSNWPEESKSELYKSLFLT